MMEYKQYRYDHKKGDAIGHYFEDKKLAAIKFYRGLGQADYERELKQKNYIAGRESWFIKNTRMKRMM